MSSIGSGSVGGERARTVSESSSGRRVGMIISGGIKRSQTDPTISPTSSSSRSLRSPSSSISHGSLISPAPSISATLTPPISPMVASDERSRTPTPSSAVDGTTPSSSNQSLAFPLTPSASTEFNQQGQGQSGLGVYGGGRLRTISGASSGGSAVHLPSVGVSLTAETIGSGGTAKKRTIMTPAAAISKSYMSRSVSGAPPSAPPASVTVAEQGSRSRATSLKGGLPTPSPSISSKASLSQSTSSSKLHPIPHSTSSSTQRSGSLHPLNNTPTTPTTPVSNTPAHSYRLGGAPPKLSSSTSSRSLSSQLQQSRSVSSPIVPPKSLSSSTNIATPPATPQASRTGTGMSYRSTSRASRLLLPRKSLGALFGGGSSSSSAGVGAGGVNRL
ncbi:hypothetical protein SISNIDRAFT_461577 [Sistotremastrum niveocremeum HHB9708]|uniref:Uncharacterized protein n=1 Tax=Sistotremastrum niveocremeum HHB9708 TaxID=1314777 RepID=A0A164MH12_9AGAM|nr:hypothetical protein SISNIDRAFT_461577 [Sistotremastrum niveocremeum HHB9708]